MKLKINTKAPNFKLPSTSKDNYSLKDSIGKYVVIIFIQKMTLRDARLKLMILINYSLNLRN